MLAQKPKETPYLAVFKTSSGEEFIGKVTEETMLAYTVSKPLCMIGTESGLKFAPYLMMADPDADVSIPKPAITGTPAKSLASQYEQATSSIALLRK